MSSIEWWSFPHSQKCNDSSSSIMSITSIEGLNSKQKKHSCQNNSSKPNKRSPALPGKTHWNPNTVKNISPQIIRNATMTQHHTSTWNTNLLMWVLLMRLWHVEIFPQVVWMKKAILLGSLEHQRLFHGKLTSVGPLNVL